MKFTKNENKSKLDEVIDDLLNQMEGKDGDSKEYEKMSDNLSKLYEAKSKMKRFDINPETLLVVGGNILGILIILAYEEKNIISSKAMKFIGKGRV